MTRNKLQQTIDIEMDEFRKSIIKEVLQDLYNKCYELTDPYDTDCEECKGSIEPCDIIFYAENYGVKIDD